MNAIYMHYAANCMPGRMRLIPECDTGQPITWLAELAARDHWHQHPQDEPTDITVVHLHDVYGKDHGLFEVRHERVSSYRAVPLGPVEKQGLVE